MSQYTAFTPYRVCPLGAHVDHQHGLISGFALDHGVTLSYEPTNDAAISVTSADFPGEATFSLRQPLPPRAYDWGDYLRGSVWALSERFPLQHGFRGHIRGSLPIGGLSSSASVILCYLQALLQVNRIRLSALDLIDVAYRAETGYVGLNVGKLDQSCEVLSQKGHLLYLDTRTQTFERIPAPASVQPFDIMVLYSGLSRTLTGTGFNDRVAQCHNAAAQLRKFAGRPAAPGDTPRLRDVTPEEYDAHKHRLTDPEKKRAAHFFGEYRRVLNGVECWRRGDIRGLGQLVFESGRSSIDNFETGSPELIALYEALCGAKGVYGARFSGAGFKGCCLALVHPESRESVKDQVTERYLSRFPEMRGKFSAHICLTSDGVMP